MLKTTATLINKESLDLVRRMAMMAQYRESGIENHLERMRGYCYVIAHGLGLSTPEVELIANASQLHDVGYVGVPDAVLAKSGQLTAYEWEQVKRHPAIGAEMLSGSPSPVLQAGELIALTHHERWDGSGYPKALQGEEIPLGGRICAVADVFDALTTKRTYKEEVPVQEALQLLVDTSGQLFDPQVVKVFREGFDEILRVRQLNI